jgi:transcriptional regulator GlxA family with amidase domain
MITPQPESRPHADGAEKNPSDGPLSPEPPARNQIDGGPVFDRRVQKVIALLSKDLSRRWTLAELAAHAGVSPRYLERLFKAQTGFTPLQLLKVLRLERARKELVGSFKSVSEVAEGVGYRAEDKHFGRYFRAEYDATPSAFRRRG